MKILDWNFQLSSFLRRFGDGQEVISINKRLFMLLSLLIFFTVIGSASAVSDDNNDLGNSLSDESVDMSEIEHIDRLSDDSYGSNSSNSNLAVVNSSNDFNESDNPNNNLSSMNSSNILPQYIKVNDSKFYSSNSQIQKIIDDANPGSTIEFTGSFYKDLRLKINKPLKIISKCGTVVNTTFNLPVFAILKGGSGTSISGFTIYAAGYFVEASDVSNISVMKNRISTKKTAILFKNVIGSNIKNNLFSSFKTAIDLSKSRGIIISKNNITPDSGYNVGINIEDCTGSGGVRIIDNRIIGIRYNSFSYGVQVGKNVSNLIIRGNAITNWRVGVHFLDSIINANIHNNTISKNGEGIVVEKGIMDRLNFTKNVVNDNMGAGFLFEDSFEGKTGDPVFENNIFSKNSMAVQSKGNVGFNIGRNFLSGNKLCVKIKMKKAFSLKFRVSGNKIFASVIGGNGWERDLPDFTTTFNVDGKDYDMLLKGGIGFAELSDSSTGSSDELSSSTFTLGDETRSLRDWGTVHDVSLEEISPYVQEYLDSLKVPENSQDDDYDNPSYENSTYYHSSNSGSGSGDSGYANGSSSISSSSNPLSSSTSSAGASPRSASSSNSPAEPADSATVKSLSVDEETFRVVGVGGLVFLILLVIGLYYREDIQEMMKDN